MLNKRTLHVIIIILALSNISVIAFMFWNRPPKPPRNPKEIIETTLNLSDEQKTSLKRSYLLTEKQWGSNTNVSFN